MSATLPVLAGVTSTIMFAFSTVPMLVKAGRTKDLSSYSLGNIVLVNIGNVVHSVYVFHLPVGPIWALHLFYLLSSAVQLTLYLRYLPRTRASLSNVALRRVRVGTSGYGPTNSVRAPLRRRRLDRSGDRLDDAQVTLGRISEDAQRSLVHRADRMRSKATKATKATAAQNMDRRARATARGLEGQRRKDPVAGSASPSPHRRQACRRAVRRGEDQAGTGDMGRVERERPAARRADQQPSTRRRGRRCSPRSAHTRGDSPRDARRRGAGGGGPLAERVLLLPDGVEDQWGPDYSDLVAMA
jgi:hypothetical protein